MRFEILTDLFGFSLSHDVSAIVGTLGAEGGEIVGVVDYIWLVLAGHDAVADIDKALRAVEAHLDIGLVRPVGRPP